MAPFSAAGFSGVSARSPLMCFHPCLCMDPSSADVLFQVVWWCVCLGSQNWKRKLIQGDLHLPADFSSGGSASLAGKIWPEEVPLTLVVRI